MDSLAFAIVAGIGVTATLIALWIVKRNERRQTVEFVKNQNRVRELLQAKDELERLAKERTRDSQEYKDAKEAYDAKWRNTANRANSRTSPDNKQG